MKTPQKRNYAIALAVLLILAMIAISMHLSGREGSQSTKKSVVRLNTPFLAVDFAPFFIAKHKKWFEEELNKVGASPEYQEPLQSIPASNEALGANRTDVLMTGEIIPIFGRAGGNDVKIAWVSASLTSEIMVPIASPIKGFGDLKGAKIGLITGSGPHYCLLKYIEDAGLKKSDVQLVNLLPPDGKIAFRQGNIDAWAIFPPWTEQETIEGTARMLPGAQRLMHGIMAASGKFSRENPILLSATIRALDRARAWMVSNPKEAQQIVSKEINLPLQVVETAWPKMDWSSTLNDTVIADIQAKANFLKDEGLIKQGVDVRNDLIVQPSK